MTISATRFARRFLFARHLLVAAMAATPVLLLQPAPAMAEADGPDHFRVTDVAGNDTLNIRSEPNARARKLGEIPPDGNGLRNLGCRGGLSFAEWQKATPAQRRASVRSRWCRIEYRGVTGWVAGRYLAEGNAPRATSASSAPARQQPIKRKLAPEETLERITIPASGKLTVSGTIEGYRHKVYAVSIGAGDTLRVELKTRSTSAYFNLIDGADGSGAAIHRGEVHGKVAQITAPSAKTYLIQPFLVRAVARRGRTAQYSFEITLASSGRAASQPSTTGSATPSATVDAKPSFDCARADNDATKLVCRDAQLAALDRETTRLFKLALAGPNMSKQRRDELVAMERGWIKGRDECWKAKDLRQCVAFSYATRIHELRQGYANARTQDDRGVSKGPFALACRGFDSGIGVTFINTDPAMAVLEWRSEKHALTLVRSGSGARYKVSYEDGRSLDLWTKGKDARLTIPGRKEMSCKIEEIG